MEKVFSDFEVDRWGAKFEGAEGYRNTECIGSYEEELDVRVITKKCRGIVAKKIVKGAGTGKIKMSAHIPYGIYTEFYGMNIDGLIEGVKAYGKNSVHKPFASTFHITDEDGVEKYKAYPKCVVEAAKASKVENGGEEVAEVEIEASLMPDEYGNCMYEALADDLVDETAKNTWMTAFTPDLVQEKEA